MINGAALSAAGASGNGRSSNRLQDIPKNSMFAQSAAISGVNPMTDPLGAVASLQQKYTQPDGTRQGINPRFLAGAKSVAPPERFTQGSSSGQAKSYVAPASTGANPFMDSSAGASTPSYTALAAAQDPINNAITAEQQQPVGDITGNMFMRQQSMQGLV